MRPPRILVQPDPVQAGADLIAEANRWDFSAAISQVESFLQMAWDYNLRNEGNNPAYWELVRLRLRSMARDRARATSPSVVPRGSGTCR